MARVGPPKPSLKKKKKYVEENNYFEANSSRNLEKVLKRIKNFGKYLSIKGR
jgi:hypothetical protein